MLLKVWGRVLGGWLVLCSACERDLGRAGGGRVSDEWRMMAFQINQLSICK